VDGYNVVGSERTAQGELGDERGMLMGQGGDGAPPALVL